MGIAVANSALLIAAGRMVIAENKNAKNNEGPVVSKPIPGKTKIPDPNMELILIVIMENKPNLLSKLCTKRPN